MTPLIFPPANSRGEKNGTLKEVAELKG